MTTPPSSSGWVRDEQWTRTVQEMWRRQGMMPPWPEGFRHNELRLAALVNREEYVPGDSRWHISVQHEKRVPDWGEMVRAAHDLRPGVVFVIPLPPKNQWMNIHERVMHLYEVKDPTLQQHWLESARSAKQHTGASEHTPGRAR